jgi:regulator of protease activity HflC (stomatin/prohibitin superfamily)
LKTYDSRIIHICIALRNILDWHPGFPIPNGQGKMGVDKDRWVCYTMCCADDVSAFWNRGSFLTHFKETKMKRFGFMAILGLAVLATGCTRIETGEVGLRVNFDKTVSNNELLPGSFNQTLVGDVLTFPVKDVNVKIDDMTPLAKDNSTMKDFDAVVIYNLNQSQVAELYNSKSKAFHVVHNGDTYLMYNYILQTARNAVYKAAREYEALDMNDQRAAIETKVKELMIQSLRDEKLDGAIAITQVLVRNILPADSVVASANELVRAKNELKQKEVEVKTAEAEARRMQALSAQSQSSIAYMNAQAALNISEGIKNGKVNTIIVPSNMTGLMLNK